MSDTTLLPKGVSFHTGIEGALGPLVRSKDWSHTALGSMTSWPQSLKRYVDMILTLPGPAIVFWGPELIQIYNDGYAVIMGPRHPQHLGSTYKESWPETYPIIYPWMLRVINNHEIVKVEKTMIFLTRFGFAEECFFTFSLTPLRDDSGHVSGVLQLVTEVTETVLSDRRKETLLKIASAQAGAENIQKVMDALQSNPSDIRCAVLFFPDPHTNVLIPSGSIGLSGGQNFAKVVEVAKVAFQTNAVINLKDLQSLLPHKPEAPWSELTTQAQVIPVRHSELDSPLGVILLGVSPHLEFEGKYQDFFESLSREIAANLLVLEQRRTQLELERAIRAAQLEKDKLQSLFLQAPAAIAILGLPDFKFEFANEPYAAIVGRSRKQILGLPLMTVFPELKDSSRKILAEVIESGQIFEAKEFLMTIDWGGTGDLRERYLNFIYAPYRNASTEIAGVMVFAVDVTEQVVERRKAKLSEELLRTVTDKLPALISYMDHQGRYKFVNDAYCKWFGKAREEIEGTTRETLISDEKTYSFVRPFEEQAFGGDPARFELTLTKQNGEYVDLDTEYLPDRSQETGAVIGIIGVGHDVTLRRRALNEAVEARKQVEQLATDLKEAVNARDEFMSIASHELKTPITSLKLQLQMTQRRINPELGIAPSPEKLAAVMGTSMKQIERLTELVEDLLDISRIQAGRLVFSFTSIKLRDVIQEVVDRFADYLEEAQISIHLDVDPALTVEWDRSRIEQVLVNLISNSIKYAPKNPITIRARINESDVVLTHHDTGPGIPAELHEKIFERFERATASRSISGLGLGLFIVRQIVLGHRGTIHLESSEGTGTTFVVKIPIRP